MLAMIETLYLYSSEAEQNDEGDINMDGVMLFGRLAVDIVEPTLSGC